MATEWNPFLNIDLEAALGGYPRGPRDMPNRPTSTCG
jgi:hypothetical protein